MLIENSIQYNGKNQEITLMAEHLARMILDAENYNHSNEHHKTSWKCEHTRNVNLNISNNAHDHTDRGLRKNKRRNEQKTSRFVDEEEMVNLPLTKRTLRKTKYQEESGDDAYQFEEENISEDNYSEE
jgi:hypothetical protein